ncbi:unnamed protein product [Caenorhabditis angaria]|uniref:7TM GPCR serpentine receptor class x (Srx) domain-containing protein n=1 Tax=Caenorhabditis angaria TaxID=860376 RepID=A0A9P1N7X4_9PELO|nr:unnamed protein product [Caenorhabditis angaria]
MIKKKTTKQLGTYKYLMQTFSLLELIFSTVDVLNQPTIFVEDGTFLLFSTNPLHLPISIARHLNILNFTFSGMIISLLAIHFIYRYFAVCHNQRLSAFDKPYLGIWISVFVLIGLEWYFASLFLGLGDSSCSFDIDNINTNENLDITVFVGVKYTIKNMTTGRENHCWKSISYALILLKIVVISGVIVVFCGWRTYKEMSGKKDI